jgi:hypothetical protein
LDKEERWKDRTYREELEKQKRYEAEKVKRAIQYLDEKSYENIKELITPK